jgi:hypothetical protein
MSDGRSPGVLTRAIGVRAKIAIENLDDHAVSCRKGNRRHVFPNAGGAGVCREAMTGTSVPGPDDRSRPDGAAAPGRRITGWRV